MGCRAEGRLAAACASATSTRHERGQSRWGIAARSRCWAGGPEPSDIWWPAADADHAVWRQAERKGAARWALPPCCGARARPRSASAGVPSESARTVLDSWPYSDHALISTQTSQLCDDFHGRHENITPCL